MFHYFETITNTRGDSLVGYRVELRVPDTNTVVAIYADQNRTPIVSVSGFVNVCVTDVAGNADFFVPFGEYDVLIGSVEGAQLKRIARVPMNGGATGDKGTPGLDGTPGDGVTLDTFGGASDLTTAGLFGPITGGTDNSPAFAAAIAQTVDSGAPEYRSARRITSSVGNRRFNTTLEPRAVVTIDGTTGGGDNITGTIWRFPPNTGGMVFNNRVTGNGGDNATAPIKMTGTMPTSEGSSINRLYMVGTSPDNTDATKHGIWARATIKARDLTVEGFAGSGIAIIANGQGRTSDPARVGLANGWFLENIVFRGNRGLAALEVRGVDANAGCAVRPQVKSAANIGIYDGSAFGNVYIAPEVDGSGSSGRQRVWHGGWCYYYMSADPAFGTIEPGSPGSDDIWYDLELALAQPSDYWKAWVPSATAYLSGAGILVEGVVNSSTIFGGYTESLLVHTAGTRCITVGGEFVATRNSAQFYVGEASVLPTVLPRIGVGGIRHHIPRSAQQSALGKFSLSAVGVFLGSAYVHQVHLDSADGGVVTYGPTDRGDFRYGRGTYDGGSPDIYMVTGARTQAQFGRGSPQPDVLSPRRLVIRILNASPMDGRGLEMVGGTAPDPALRARGDVAMNTELAKGGPAAWGKAGDGTMQPIGIVGAVQALGLTASSTLADVIAALKTAGLAA